MSVHARDLALRNFPTAFADRARRLAEPACVDEKKRHRMVGDFIQTVVGNICDWDSVAFRRRYIDVVVPDSVADDRPAARLRRRGDHGFRDRYVSHHDRVSLAGLIDQRLLITCRRQPNFGVKWAQDLLFDLERRHICVGDQNPIHLV